MLVNGKEYLPPAGSSIEEILKDLGFDIGRVAVLFNDEVVPKDRLSELIPASGGTLEVVSFVGGG